MMNSQDLYEACLEEKGNRQAWGTLYLYIIRRIGRYGGSLTHEEMEDLAQDVILSIYQSLRSRRFQKPRQFLNLCLKLSEWRTLDYLRARKRNKASVSLSEEEGAGRDRETGPVVRSRQNQADCSNYDHYRIVRTVQRALARWKNTSCREILEVYFRYKAGDPGIQSYTMMAEKLDKKLGTLANAINRCLKRFQKLEEIQVLLRSHGKAHFSITL